MASISREKNGRRSIQFVGPDKKRRTVRLGKTSQRTAEAVKVRVEHLVAAVATGHALEAETARWLTEISDDLAAKLTAVGLAPGRASALLGPFLDDYMVRRTDVKGSTRTFYGHTMRNLLLFFNTDPTSRGGCFLT